MAATSPICWKTLVLSTKREEKCHPRGGFGWSRDENEEKEKEKRRDETPEG